MSVGHEDIQPDKHSRHQYIRQQCYQKTYHRPEQQQIGHAAGHRRNEYRKTGRQNNQYWEKQEHGQIVSKSAEDAPLFLHLPYTVECTLNVAHQHEYRVEHKNKTDTKEYTAFGVNQITVDKLNNDVGRLRLRLEGIAKPHLYIFVIAETTGNGKNHSHYRHYGQQR